MKLQRLLVFVCIVLVVMLLSGCRIYNYPGLVSMNKPFSTFKANHPRTTVPAVATTCKCTSTPILTIDKEYVFSLEEQKKIQLYALAMRTINELSNMGKDFIAIKLETLDGLNREGKLKVMFELYPFRIPSKVVSYDVIKDDPLKFDEYGQPINGTVLSVKLKEYTGTTATIDASSFFGVVGADFATYDAIYKDGKWILKWVGGGVS